MERQNEIIWAYGFKLRVLGACYSKPNGCLQPDARISKTFSVGKNSTRIRVLDIGCGDGRNIVTILKNADEVIGIDNDPLAVKNSAEKIKGCANVKICEVDATALPFEAESFDVVTLVDVMENLNDSRVPILKECGRVLKKNGAIITMTYSENAFDERMRAYELAHVPIKDIRGTTVVFDESVGANVSEQFSKAQLEQLCVEAELNLTECTESGIVYLCTASRQ